MSIVRTPPYPTVTCARQEFRETSNVESKNQGRGHHHQALGDGQQRRAHVKPSTDEKEITECQAAFPNLAAVKVCNSNRHLNLVACLTLVLSSINR